MAMSTVAIITHKTWLWYAAIGFGAVALGLAATAYVI
ncbi:MAG: hypothetical protein WDM81_12885 [Rhizomicrobium sp.]